MQTEREKGNEKRERNRGSDGNKRGGEKQRK